MEMVGRLLRMRVLILMMVLVVESAGLVRAGFEEEQVIAQVTQMDSDVAEEDFLDGTKVLLDADNYFQKFVNKFGKVYGGVEEYAFRLAIFKDNLLKAVQNQALDPDAHHGVTQFMDITEEDFASRYLGLNVPEGLRKTPPQIPSLPTEELPVNFDWRDAGAVSEVKNQGSCGSCWAFSTTGAIEGAHFLATGQLLSLSEQQLVDCDHQCDPEIKYACDSGCGGGLMTNAYRYVIQAGGLELESDYAYSGKDGKCKFDASKIAARVANFTNIPVDEGQIAANLVKHGPLAVGINAAFMQTYIGGVSCPLLCSKKRLDHGVLLVGYGEQGFAPMRMKYKPYWIIKNSWGSSWGEKGYYRICRGHGECGVNTMVSAVAAIITEN